MGAFDGVHAGHQRVLAELGAFARDLGARPRVVTFDRHPLEVLIGRAPLQILSLEHKLLHFARAGVAETLVLSFDREMSLWPAEEFVKRVVIDSLRARGLLMGFDSALGHKRQGTFESLSSRSTELGIEIRQAGIERIEGDRVSSSLVRDTLQAGDLDRLRLLLARRFSLFGCVREGEGRGRRIGVPTANVDVGRAGLPPLGVYFAEVSRLGRSFDEILAAPGEVSGAPAVVNIGLRPTFKDPNASAPVVEAHILDWEGSLYGEHLEVHLLKRHRREQKFSSAEELVAQIHRDIEACRAYARP